MNQRAASYILFILFCVIFDTRAQKQDSKLKIYTLNDGLSNSHIMCMTQDSKGFMWIGTDNGLNKFDGFDFVTFSNIPKDQYSLPGDEVSALHVDKTGNMWVGTSSGLAKFDSKTQKFYSFPFFNPDSSMFVNPIRSIIEDNNGNLWIATAGSGLHLFNIQSQKFKKIPDLINKISKNILHIFALTFDNENRLWIGLEKNGLYCIDFENDHIQLFNSDNSSLKNNTVLSLLYKNNKMWIGTRGGGLSVYNFNSRQIETYDDLPSNAGQLKSNDIYTIDIDNEGLLWLGTNNNGLLLFNPEKKIFLTHSLYESEEKFKTKSLKNIYRDKNGNLWFGIFQLGIAVIKNYESPFYDNLFSKPDDKDLISNSVLGIFVDSSGELWIGTDGRGLINYNRKTKKYKHFKYFPASNSIASNVVRTIFEDSKKQLWIGTYKGGLSKLDRSTGKFTNYFLDKSLKNHLDVDDIVAFIEDRNGNLWIASGGNGLFKYNESDGVFENFFPRDNKFRTSICNEYIMSLFLDSKGFIWIGTSWGLSRFDPIKEEFTNYFHDDKDSGSITNNIVIAVNEDKNGNIWVGTKYGLNILNKEKNTFKGYTVKNGLPGNIINSILTDNNNNLWLSTNYGLCCFNTESGSVQNFYYADGLQGNEFIHNSAFKSKDGKLFFGGVSGFNSFYPENIKSKVSFPEVILTDFQIFNRSVSIGKLPDGRILLEQSISETNEIYLDYSDNSFSFEFVALDYIQPENIQYACKMEGFDDYWNINNYRRRFITYTNLNPGTYVFKVKASNRKDKWGEKVTQVIIHIRPSFWNTGWAYLLYFIIVLTSAFFLSRIMMDRIRVKRQIKLEKQKNEQMDQINQAKLEFFTNISHEFRTPLTLIIGPIESMLESKSVNNQIKTGLQMMHRNANRLLRLVNQLLDLRKIEKGKLKLQAREMDVNAFIYDIFQTFQELAKRKNINFLFENQIPGLNIWFDADKLDKILFNLLSNAFKYTPENGRIELSVSKINKPFDGYKNGVIQISVSDNGRGMSVIQVERAFERFYQSIESDNTIQRGSGIGLSLTKSLVELHHGKIIVQSVKGEGSIFIITLPLGKSHLSDDEKLPEEFYQSANLNLQPVVLDGFEDSFSSENQTIADESAPLVMLVEDNEELRLYMKNGLQSVYRIAEAKNGIEGLEKAFDLMPDLIISDVMMPEMDGIQFCKKIKTELLTCHIPVILLTAKTSIEHRIEGLETGADSFIPKPFNSRHLMVRIQKLIELRQTLKEKFKSNGHFEPVEMAVTPVDEKFISRAVEIIRKEISNADFNVENLSHEIGMSRGHLQRKLKALVGQNPSDFIRSIRLKQSAHMLINENISVSEICYMVGFSSPSYFANCFHKQFGLTPTEYKNKKTEKPII